MSIKEKIAEFVKGRPREPMFDDQGRTICDPKPLKYSAGLRKPPTTEVRLARILAAHQAHMKQSQEYVDETDFDIDRPEYSNEATFDMLTIYERNNHVFEMEPEVPVARAADDKTPLQAPIKPADGVLPSTGEQ